jgi:hypothetical protein
MDEDSAFFDAMIIFMIILFVVAVIGVAYIVADNHINGENSLANKLSRNLDEKKEDCNKCFQVNNMSCIWDNITANACKELIINKTCMDNCTFSLK